MCPHSVAAETYIRTSQRTRKLRKCFHPLFFLSLQPFARFTPSFLCTTFLKTFFLFIKLTSINHNLHLHLSGFSPLSKILTVNHYLHSPDFQHLQSGPACHKKSPGPPALTRAWQDWPLANTERMACQPAYKC